jgi:hypothetical protein
MTSNIGFLLLNNQKIITEISSGIFKHQLTQLGCIPLLELEKRKINEISINLGQICPDLFGIQAGRKKSGFFSKFQNGAYLWDDSQSQNNIYYKINYRR